MSLHHSNPELLALLFSTHFQDTKRRLSMVMSEGETPLDVAMRTVWLPNNSEEDTLMDFISLCNSVPSFWDGQNPVFPRAFTFQSERIVQLLLSFNLDPDNSGFTPVKPLHQLTPAASADRVRFLISLFPGHRQSRHIGRLPIESYIDVCIVYGDAPNPEVLNLLTFDSFLTYSDGEGLDPWLFLCSSASRLGTGVVHQGWDAFHGALSHYILGGCIERHEAANGDCGLRPLLSMLLPSTRLMACTINRDLLERAIVSSRFWEPRSELVVRFFKAALYAVNLDTVEILMHNSRALDELINDDETVAEFAFSGEVASRLCSVTRGKETFSLILNTQSRESLKTSSSTGSKGDIFCSLAHPSWEEAAARWILEQLVDRGLDIDSPCRNMSDGLHPDHLTLHLSHKSLAMAEVLLDMGANPNAHDDSERIEDYAFNPVRECSQMGYVDILEKILQVSKRDGITVSWESLFPIDIRTGEKWWSHELTGLQMACFKGHRKCVNFFLKNTTVNNQLKSNRGYTALHFAAMGGTVSIIENLVAHGFDVMAEADDKTTPIYWAVELGRAAATQTLINLGATNYSGVKLQSPIKAGEINVDAEVREVQEDEFGKHSHGPDGNIIINPLHLQLKSAIEEGDLSYCQSLIHQGCPLDAPIPRTENESLLAWSLIKNKMEIAKWFLEQGASVRWLCKSVTQPEQPFNSIKYLLHWCVSQGKYAILRLLLQNGALVDCVDDLGNTPLHYATTLESVDLLLKYGASPVDILTRSLAVNFDCWGRSSIAIFETAIRAAKQQTHLSSLEWIDGNIPIRSFYPRRQGAIAGLSKLLGECQGEGLFNYLASLLFGSGLRPLVKSNLDLGYVRPFPWHLYSPEDFCRVSFLSNYYHIVCGRFGYESVTRWANLERVEGWSPLCRSASQNCTEKMQNCLSLGAEIDFEGCPLGSALMIASACGQLEAVKLLIRKGARVCYEGRVGRLSVFGVARSEIVKSWLLIGRFNDQQRIKHTAERDTPTETKYWSGPVQARANLLGYKLVRDNETRIDCAKRLSEYARRMRGRVAPYIEGLVFNRHEPPTPSAFATVDLHLHDGECW